MFLFVGARYSHKGVLYPPQSERIFLFFFSSFSHLACDEERVEAAKLLVEHGASIYIENKEEKTPLQIAKGGLGNILRRLVEG